jgi:hypothetical protein
MTKELEEVMKHITGKNAADAEPQEELNQGGAIWYWSSSSIPSIVLDPPQRAAVARSR